MVFADLKGGVETNNYGMSENFKNFTNSLYENFKNFTNSLLNLHKSSNNKLTKVTKKHLL